MDEQEKQEELYGHFSKLGDEFLTLYENDVEFEVQGERIPAHGAFLACYSKFFCRFLSDMKGANKNTATETTCNTKMIVPLDETVRKTDVELMLSVLYGSCKTVDSVGTKNTIVFIEFCFMKKSKYFIMKICEDDKNNNDTIPCTYQRIVSVIFTFGCL